MSPPQEHSYIGLSAAGAAASCEDDGELNLKDTELCLGLPGSASPELMENSVGRTLGLLPSAKAGANVFGAKRGFADAIDGAGKWGLSAGGAGFKAEDVKGGALFSSVGDGAGAATGGAPGGSGKDAVSLAAAGGQEKAAGTEGRSFHDMATDVKEKVVGWPPIRGFRKNTVATNPSKNMENAEGKRGLRCLYVKVSMEGAPYLRKVDLKTYNNYRELSLALEKMFNCFMIGQCGSHGILGRDGLSEIRLMDLINDSEYILTYEDKDGDWMLVGDVPWEMFTNSCRRLKIMKGSDAIGLAPRALEKSKRRS